MSSRKSRRRAAQAADERRLELELQGKSELAKVKRVVTSTRIAFTAKQAVVCRNVDEEATKDELQKSKREFEDASNEYLTAISTLLEVYEEKNDGNGQNRLSEELEKAETEIRRTNEKYASHFAELKSIRSTTSSHSRSASVASSIAQESQTNQEEVINDLNNKHVSNGDSAPAWNRLALTDEEFRLKFLVDHTDNAVPRNAEDNNYPKENECYQEAGQEDYAGSDCQRENIRKAQRDLDELYIRRHRNLKEQDDGLQRRNFVTRASDIVRGSHEHRIEGDMWRQLKRVEIPTFSGDKHAYAGWKAAFVTCIDAAPVTPEYKLLQLRSYLKGEALRAIESLGHSASAYQAALERLERKFGGERRQVTLRLEDLDNFRPMRDGTAKEIDKFADILDLLVINLKESGRMEELGCGSLYFKAIKKLTDGMIIDYKRWIDQNLKEESMEVLREWIIREADYKTIATETLRGLSNRGYSTQTYYGEDDNRFEDEHSLATQQERRVIVCPVCSNRHPIWKCDDFKKLDISARWDVASKKRLCFRCLSSGHRGANCTRSQTCGIDDCQNTHSRFLHREEMNAEKAAEPEQNADDEEFSHTAMREGQSSIALRTIPVIVRNGAKSIAINALLDDGSTRTYINADVAAELGLLTGETDEITVGTMGGAKRTFSSEAVSFVIESADGRTSRSVQAFTTTNVTGAMKTVEWKKFAPDWKHLKDLNFPRVA